MISDNRRSISSRQPSCTCRICRRSDHPQYPLRSLPAWMWRLRVSQKMALTFVGFCSAALGASCLPRCRCREQVLTTFSSVHNAHSKNHHREQCLNQCKPSGMISDNRRSISSRQPSCTCRICRRSDHPQYPFPRR